MRRKQILRKFRRVYLLKKGDYTRQLVIVATKEKKKDFVSVNEKDNNCIHLIWFVFFGFRWIEDYDERKQTPYVVLLYTRSVLREGVDNHYMMYFDASFVGKFVVWGSRDGAVVRALASHQCGPGLGFICGLSLLLVLVLVQRGFFRVLRFSLSSKTNASIFQFYPESAPQLVLCAKYIDT